MSRIQSLFIHKRREIVAYLRLFLKHQNIPYKKFVIFCQGRTGSTLLYSLLNSHQQIHCDEEILEDSVFFPFQYVKGRCAKAKKNVYGFRVKIYQLIHNQHQKPEKFLLNLSKDGWQIIYLKRTNILRQAISRMVAKSKDEWHTTLTDKHRKSKRA